MEGILEKNGRCDTLIDAACESFFEGISIVGSSERKDVYDPSVEFFKFFFFLLLKAESCFPLRSFPPSLYLIRFYASRKVHTQISSLQHLGRAKTIRMQGHSVICLIVSLGY